MIRRKVPNSKMVRDHDDRPVLLIHPTVSYPSRMAERSKDGECIVTFDVPRAGPAQNIKASCTNEGFVEMSENAVRSMVFAPLSIDDEFIPQAGIPYPIEYDIR